MLRDRVFTNAVWEKEVGYCRAIRAGDHIYVTGTAPIDEVGKVFAPGDAYAQARHDDPVTHVLSVGWSQWAEVGMAAGLNGAGEGGAGLPDDLGEGTAIDHPVLERLHALSDDELVAAATLSPETHWLLDEHRIANAGALIPGTGYLELARAAHALVSPGPASLSDVTDPATLLTVTT